MRFIGQSASHMTCHYVGHMIQRHGISTLVSSAFRHAFGQMQKCGQGQKCDIKNFAYSMT